MANPLSPLVPDSSTHLIGSIPVSQLVAEWKRTYGIDVVTELAGTEVVSLYRCDVTQLDFFQPDTVAGSDRLYQDLQQFDWYYMSDKWEFAEALRDLGRCRRILEVGCGVGLFVERIVQDLPASSVKGIDTNESAIARALKKNLPVELIDLAGVCAKGASFDAVCSFQVLEHSARPRELLEDMVRLLKPGGRLVVSVPNKHSFLKHQHNLLDMPPHHMTRWSETTFRYLEHLMPLKLTRLRFEPLAKYHTSGYLGAYGSYWRSRISFGKRFLSDPSLTKIAAAINSLGLNRLLLGQTLYAVFEKL